MKITTTLSRYLAKTYFINMIILLAGLLVIIYLFDTVELIRRTNKKSDIPLSLILQMGLLKLPEVGQILFPFAILFSGMFTFRQLTKRYELIVVRAAGFSVWQFLAPVIGVAVFMGFIQMAIINPVGSLLIGKFERLENTYLKHNESHIVVFKEGLWLRQESEEGYFILHAEKVEQPDWTLKNLMVLFFNDQDQFLRRVNARQASLEKGRWFFRDVSIHENLEAPVKENFYALPTTLTTADIKESFASPRTMSFWNLPGYIKTLEETGFDASRLRVHYHNLLSQPLMFAAMILLAAAFSMRPPRHSGAAAMLAIGVFTGFVVFFISSFLQAMGASQQIPVIIAAWSPAFIVFLLGLSAMINLEDG